MVVGDSRRLGGSPLSTGGDVGVGCFGGRMIVEEAVWKCCMYSLSQYLRFPFVYKGEDMDGLSRLQKIFMNYLEVLQYLGLNCLCISNLNMQSQKVSLNCTKTSLIAHRQRHRESMEVTHRVVTEDR